MGAGCRLILYFLMIALLAVYSSFHALRGVSTLLMHFTCDSQEDAHSVVLEMEGAPKTGFFGVFDGHGGKEVARFTALYLVSSCGLAPSLILANFTHCS